MPRILLRPRAKTDLLDIWEYFEEHSGAANADRFIRKIEKQLISLANFPSSGRLRNDLRPGLRTTTVGRYVILYYPFAEGIKLERIIYGARDLNRLEIDDEDDMTDDADK